MILKIFSQLFHNKLRFTRKMITLTDEQKICTKCDWCEKDFNDDYFCNKCYERLDCETGIKCNENKYPIEIDKDKQSFDEDNIEMIYRN